MPLLDWQQPFYERQRDILKRDGVALNALPTGAGKTYITASLLTDFPNHKLFVTCPKAVITAWHRVTLDLGFPPERVLGVWNWEKLQTKRTPFYTAAGWQLPKDTLFVADEVHKGASGPTTITTKMLAAIKIRSIPTVLQSATVADSPLKLRAAGYLLGLHDFNTASFYAWCRKWGCYASPFHSGLDFPKGKRGLELMKRMHDELLKDKMLRCTFDDIPGFPECQTEAVLFDLDAKYTAEVNRIYEELEETLKKPNTNELVEQLRARQRVELFKVPLLTDLANDHVADGKSVVVFTSFRGTQDKLVAELGSANVVRIYGGQGEAERQAAIDSFQSNDKHVILVMIQAGGAGLSLHDVHHARPRVALLCPTYSATDFKQALGRVHRVGGTKALQCVVLAAGTVEERVKRAIDRKVHNIDALNGLTDEDLK